MEENLPKAFKELYIILNQFLDNDFNKIPDYFIKFITENMDINYNPEINFNKNIEESVLEETLLLLALIYRDYIISEEEREQLIKEERYQIEKINKTYMDLFHKEKLTNYNNVSNVEKQLVIIKKEKWYKKILNNLLSIFNS